MIEVIAEHSVNWPASGPVLDVGCRSFNFSKELARRGFGVVAMDPDPTILDPRIAWLTFINQALVSRDMAGPLPFIMDKDPQARRIGITGDTVVRGVDIVSLSRSMGVDHWGIVKLDCEGCEYDILRDWPGPIADQITVEFHEHISLQPESVYADIIAHLGQWYDVAQHEKSLRHCIGTPNYWDSLFLVKR